MHLQWLLGARRLEDLLPLFVIPLGTVVSMAAVSHFGRPDLMPLPVTAGILMTIGQMAFFVGGEAVEGDRREARFEGFVGASMPYSVHLFLRVLALSVLGTLGAAETWFIAYWGFDVALSITRPGLFAACLLLTALSAAGTGVLISALFSMGRTARTFQNAMSGPLYLLGGVFVPVALLPSEIQSLSKGIFLYWAADLLRGCLGYEQKESWGLSLFMIAALGALAFLLGHLVLKRMIHRLAVTGEANLA